MADLFRARCRDIRTQRAKYKVRALPVQQVKWKSVKVISISDFCVRKLSDDKVSSVEALARLLTIAGGAVTGSEPGG
jgi:hypothetical protein